MKCLLKKTKFGKLSFCRDDLDLDRYPIYYILQCQRENKVEHCVDCKNYPKKGENMRTIKCVLREPECDKNGVSYHSERLAELHYKDDKYEVYSYECGDGIWGTYWEEFEDMEKDLGKEVVDKWVESGYEDMELELPFSFVEKRGYSILTKKGKPLRVSNKDMEHMCFDGVIELPDGSLTEPDGDNSPLRQMGLI